MSAVYTSQLRHQYTEATVRFVCDKGGIKITPLPPAAKPAQLSVVALCAGRKIRPAYRIQQSSEGEMTAGQYTALISEVHMLDDYCGQSRSEAGMN